MTNGSSLALAWRENVGATKNNAAHSLSLVIENQNNYILFHPLDCAADWNDGNLFVAENSVDIRRIFCGEIACFYSVNDGFLNHDIHITTVYRFYSHFTQTLHIFYLTIV